ncbi:MAG: signal recognition particle protein [Deltaproteobacteria bacterium]|nr:signal recognition particle protein [Deltaproteobacteria bacterium]
MFDSLTEKLEGAFKKLRSRGRLTPENIQSGLREVRMALLEADVHYKVTKDFVKSVQERAVGSEVLKSLTPAQQVIKIVHEELIALMGGQSQELNLQGPRPHVVMLVGLQGSGKTTTAGKLALHLTRKGRSCYMVSTDVYRPAAIKQLEKVGQQIQVETFSDESTGHPVDLARAAVRTATQKNLDVVIVDTAGRLHIDQELMQELKDIKDHLNPCEILLVADSMTGQDAVNVAREFDEALDLGGVILTKLDGDARGGAALSIKSVTGKPIKLVGVGEKLDALEMFHPDRMASRILGMGDILTLVEKAQATIDEEQAQQLERKIRKDAFTLEDFLNQLKQIKKMGSMEQLLSMVPGFGKLKQKGLQPDEKELTRIEAIINSMTKDERNNHQIINASRRKRIASGSGATIQDVNSLVKNFAQMKKMLRQFGKGGKKKLMRGGLPF